LGDHVGDDPSKVLQNRALLSAHIQSQINYELAPLVWLKQTHSNLCIELPQPESKNKSADAVYTSMTAQPSVVMTADCMAIMISNSSGTEVAAVHAGWRGLADGVIENTIASLGSKNSDLMVWFAPNISQANFEVGQDVASHFEEFPQAFQATDTNEPASQKANKFQLDMRYVAEQKLKSLGVKHIYQSDECTYASDTLFSHRRYSHNNLLQTNKDASCGRMANIILIPRSHP
jgi:YfiH family protein